MEIQGQKSKLSAALPYAGILAILMAAVTLLSYLSGLAFFWGGVVDKLLKALVFLTGFIVVMSNWKKQQVSATYGNAFVFGLIVIVLYAVFLFVFDFCFYQFIAPDYYSELRNHTLQMMIDYKLPQSQIDETDAQFEKGVANATAFGLSGQMVLMRIIADAILLSIVAIFLRKKEPQQVFPNVPQQ